MLYDLLTAVLTVGVVAITIAVIVRFAVGYFKRRSIGGMLKSHFRHVSLSQIAVTDRMFPVHIRADLQQTINDFVSSAKVKAFVAVHQQHGFGGVGFSELLDETFIRMGGGVLVGPPQYEQIDVGEADPIEVLKNGLWLLEKNDLRFALLYAPYSDYSSCGISQRVRIQLAVINSESGTKLTSELFRQIEKGILNARSYRGKVLSFEQVNSYTGTASGVRVHRLGSVARDEVILPSKTLELLDRNVVRFVENRSSLHGWRMSTKKGLLFYGPPGTGKTHTIRYLASSLKDHTTFLISAEQIALLSEYMTLARLLQPSIVVIEDVDLLARQRSELRDTSTELLLNKLLNEMDGLREDADILFILTTNRPEELETALSSRPGRIDQAIEFPFPDVAGREKLVRLYSHGLTLSEDLKAEITRRTENVSASFIKELMRRAAQFNIERNGAGNLTLEDIANALDEMLFSGGSLNLKLLGAEGRLESEDQLVSG